MSQITVKKATQEELNKLGVESWGIWTCKVSTFDWHYDERETCFILEGQVTVSSPGQELSFGKGDLVVFPKGLSCTWKVLEAVKKHYRFG